jgi:hypothetical protein
MNFSQLKPFFDAFSASLAHDDDDDDDDEGDDVVLLGHMKKFLDPNPFTCSSLSRPTNIFHKTNNQSQPYTCPTVYSIK